MGGLHQTMEDTHQCLHCHENPWARGKKTCEITGTCLSHPPVVQFPVRLKSASSPPRPTYTILILQNEDPLNSPSPYE